MEQDPKHDVDSDEKTDDAIETKMWFTSLQLAKQRKHPTFLKILQNLKTDLNDRLLRNEIERDSALSSANRDCLHEKAAAEEEFAENKANLIVTVCSELEHEKMTLRQNIDAIGLTGEDNRGV
uniref:Uncharacterized protein n=1 Tax=Anopheles minimus TaxID=112268 RepID=A0A182WQV8_9DIPT